MLSLEGVRAGYGAGEVLHGVDLDVANGGVTALLGPNGAGKSTLLKVAAGLLPCSSGRVYLDGRNIAGHSPAELARCGIYLVPEGRAVFPSLTVRDNLRLATAAPAALGEARLPGSFALFPRLKERLGQTAGTLSGGEQQMLALARAYLADPRVLLLDEPSLGLAPIVLDGVFEAIAAFKASGVSIVLVEQYVHRALALADEVYVLSKGQIAFRGQAGQVSAARLEQHYLKFAS